MATPKQLHRLATNPMAMMRFQTTGRLPREVAPCSPLIDLLSAISPRDRIALVGLQIDPRLGYQGSRTFHNGEQALRWVRPETSMLESESWPAESWRIKAFRGPLHIEQLIENAASCPEGLADRYPRLCAHRRTPVPTASSDSNPDIDSAPADRPRG